jgi:ABC-type cobalamin/Fe3+-siderophores transport system ATPase subunit
MDALLAIRAGGITKCFGDVVALDGTDLDVAQGQIHGLAGRNGAGKTTLLGLMLGLAVADGGRLEILGTPVRRALAALQPPQWTTSMSCAPRSPSSPPDGSSSPGHWASWPPRTMNSTVNALASAEVGESTRTGNDQGAGLPRSTSMTDESSRRPSPTRRPAR